MASPRQTYDRDQKHAVIDNASSGDNTVVAAVAGKRILVTSYTLVVAGALTVRWESGASGTALTGQMQFAANGGTATAANTLLNLELSAGTSCDGHLTYVEID
jgi:hypothetical protein